MGTKKRLIRRRTFIKKSSIGVSFGTVMGLNRLTIQAMDESGEWYPMEEPIEYEYKAILVDPDDGSETESDLTKQLIVDQALAEAAEQHAGAELPTAAELLEALGWDGEGGNAVSLNLKMKVTWEEFRTDENADPTKFRNVIWEYEGNLIDELIGQSGVSIRWLMIQGHGGDDIFRVGDIEMNHANVPFKGTNLGLAPVQGQQGLFKVSVDGGDPYVYYVKKSSPVTLWEPQKVFPEEDEAEEQLEVESFEFLHSPNEILLRLRVPVTVDGEEEQIDVDLPGIKWDVPKVERPE